jgi:hypothetical protein
MTVADFGVGTLEVGSRNAEVGNEESYLFDQFSDEIEDRLSGDHKIHEGRTDGVLSFFFPNSAFRLPISLFLLSGKFSYGYQYNKKI